MKRCWYISDEQSNLIAPPAILFMALCISSGLKELYLSANPSRFAAIAVFICTVPFTYLTMLSLASARRYKIDEKGLIIQYPFGITKIYLWNELREVSLCKVHYASACNAHKLAIRCSVIEEKHGPKQAIVGKEAWSTMEYEILHFGKIITIYYSDARYAEFQSFCPFDIVDYQYLEERQ